MNRQLEIRKAIEDLSSQEVKKALRLIMLQLDTAGNNNDTKVELYDSLKELYNALLDSGDKRLIWEPNEDASNVHIAFGDSFTGSLSLAVKQMGYINTHKIVTLRDFFSIGPLWRLYEEEGRILRKEWFRDHINNDHSEVDEDDAEMNYQNLLGQIDRIPAQAAIVVWNSGNAYEQTGLRYAIHLLRNKPNKIF